MDQEDLIFSDVLSAMTGLDRLAALLCSNMCIMRKE